MQFDASFAVCIFLFDFFYKILYFKGMRKIPLFPEFDNFSPYMYDELFPLLNELESGISEFTFLSLYLHQKKYNYNISALGNSYILVGNDKKGSFFAVMGDEIDFDSIKKLIATYGRWKLISEKLYDTHSQLLLDAGYTVTEDIDNQDYLYSKESLSTLAGKSLQKKRNLANNFEKSYNYKVLPLDISTSPDAGIVLDEWQKSRPTDIPTDYEQSFYALSLLPFTDQKGIVVYVDDNPVAWALGEPIAKNSVFVVHFEKGLDEYKGVYQFVNKATAQSLDESIQYINREQDLGDEGLRQAKLTYRPIGFVKKYVATKP